MSQLSTTSNNQNIAQAAAVSAAALQQALASAQIKPKPYTANITRAQPTAFVFLIDQSGSMSEEIMFDNQQRISKAKAVADVINQALTDLLNKCQKSEGLRDYFNIAIIGYGQDNDKANIAWEGNLAGKSWVSMAELFDNKISEKAVATTKVQPNGSVIPYTKRFSEWISPVHQNRTPMHSALTMAAEMLEQWMVAHQGIDCFPPTVINITDGAATDANNVQLLQAAKRIKTLHTSDGNVLLFNVHLSSASTEKVVFPVKIDELPDNLHTQLLFDMSSELPDSYNEEIAKLFQKDFMTFTAMTFNADIKTLVKVINVGTTYAKDKLNNPA